MQKTCMLCRSPIGSHDLRYMLPSYRNMNLFWAWVKASANPDLLKYPAQVLAKRQLMVCGLHFHPEDFVKLGKLRPDAVPTLCLPKPVDVGDAVIDLPESNDTQTISVQLGHFPNIYASDTAIFSTIKRENPCGKKKTQPKIEIIKSEEPVVHKNDSLFRPFRQTNVLKIKIKEASNPDCLQFRNKFFTNSPNIKTYTKRVKEKQLLKTYRSSVRETNREIATKKSDIEVAKTVNCEAIKVATTGDIVREVVNDEVILSQNSYCRICLKVIFENSKYEELSEGSRMKLMDVYPEIDLKLTPDPVICCTCLNLLDSAYKLKKLVTTTETRLKQLHPTQLFPPSLTPKPTNQRLKRKDNSVSLRLLVPKLKKIGNIMDSSLDEYFTRNPPSLKFQKAVGVAFEIKREKWGMGPWLCEICGKLFTKKYHIEFHTLLNNQKKRKTFVCDVCGIIKNTPQSFYSHRKNHLGTEFQCVHCNRKFSKFFYLQKHLDNAHSRVGAQYQCEQCGKVFGAKLKFKQHLLNHKARMLKKATKCGECGKEFLYETNLKRHMLRHVKVFYNCEVCGKKIKRLKSLDRHVKLMHYNESEFKCEICNKGFWKKITLMEHNIKVHGGEPRLVPEKILS